MNTTENYKLKKPEPTDTYNVDDMNYNSELIDGILKLLNTALDGKQPILNFMPVRQEITDEDNPDSVIKITYNGNTVTLQINNANLGEILTNGSNSTAKLPVNKLSGILPISSGGTGTTTIEGLLGKIFGIGFHLGTLGDKNSVSHPAWTNCYYSDFIDIGSNRYVIMLFPNPSGDRPHIFGIRRSSTSRGQSNSGWNQGNENSTWIWCLTLTGTRNDSW